MSRSGVGLKNIPCQVICLMPPGTPAGIGACTATPSRKTLPDRPDDGTVVTHWPLQNTVVAIVTVGEKMTVADGTGTMKSAPSTVNWIEPVKPIVTGSEPRPCTLRTLLNQMKSPPLIFVPLKFDVMEDPGAVCAKAFRVMPATARSPSPVPIPD